MSRPMAWPFLVVLLLCHSTQAAHHFFTETFSTKTSLGLKLTSDLKVIGFSDRSPAAARGVAHGDVLVSVNAESLENAGNKGLALLSKMLQTMPWPRKFRFRRVGPAPPRQSDGAAADDEAGGHSDAPADAHADRARNTPGPRARQRKLPRGLEAEKISMVFSQNERIGIHFLPNLTFANYARGSSGEVHAAEREGRLRRGDALMSINHNFVVIKDLLQHRWPSVAAVRYLDSLLPPVVLQFVRRRDLSKHRQKRDAHGRRLDHALDLDLTESAHHGDHVDIALEGQHHNHDAGDFSHHSNNAFRIIPAEFGAPPTCDRNVLRAASPLHACESLAHPEQLRGAYAVVIRGTCSFVEKARAVQSAGAVGVIVVNTGSNKLVRMPGALFGMADAAADITIPAVMVESRAYDTVVGQVVEAEGAAVRRWTARMVVGDNRCQHDPRKDRIERLFPRDPIEYNRVRQLELDGVVEDDDTEEHYAVGPTGQAVYRRKQARDQAHIPVLGGTMVFNVHEEGHLTVEYLVAAFGPTTVPGEAHPVVLLPEAEACPGTHRTHHQHAGVFLVMHLAAAESACDVAAKVDHARTLGARAVIFTSEDAVVRPLGLQESVHPVTETPPVLSLSHGDSVRLRAYVSSRPRPPEAMVWPDHKVTHAWSELALLDDPLDWPRDAAARRRLVRRMARSAGNSLSQKTALDELAAKATRFYGGREGSGGRRDEL